MDWELFYNSFRKPDFIPGYEIQNRLGGGAFGDVYKARKVSIDKHYAIKFLKIDEPQSRSAIERELEQVRHFAAIDHPNLVTVEDMGVVLDVPYLVMGYAGEDTLARRLRRERLSSEKGLLYFVQIGRGVNALHERRLAHFDLKPSNVFLKGDVARVGDYGLAKLMIDGRQTLSFGRGTPHYMAPEMLKNRADMRADIYSLGVMLYEIASGKLPFEPTGDSGVVLREDDRPPPFPEGFSPPLRPVIERCLRLAPEARFQTVGELLATLGQTARAGDPLHPLTEASATAAMAGLALARTPSTPRAELRATATEITRGAVEVARGVWEGLRAPRSESKGTGRTPVRSEHELQTPATPGGSAAAVSSPAPEATDRSPPPRVASTPASGGTVPRPVAGDVLAIQTLEEAAQGTRPGSGIAPLAALQVTREPSPRPATSPSSQLALAAGSSASAGTIPVPPRAQGGALRAVWATLQLGLEVLVILLSGPARRALGSVGRAGDRFVRGGRSLLGGLLRLFIFLSGMMLLGAGLMYLLVQWVAL